MKIIKKTIIPIFVLFVLFLIHFTTLPVNAKTNNEEEGIQPQGIYTSLDLKIDGGNGYITATVKNKISIFPSTVYVIVQLYSSDSYQDSWQNMTLVSQNSITDLDMGKSISTSASTNGMKKYWQARTYYRIDKKDWSSRNTATYLFDENGIIVL